MLYNLLKKVFKKIFITKNKSDKIIMNGTMTEWLIKTIRS